MDIKRLFIISGPASVGKTTVSRILGHHLTEKLRSLMAMTF